MDILIKIYQYFIFFYSIAITIGYLTLAVLGFITIHKSKRRFTKGEERLLDTSSDMLPGISIVAPAYNEEKIILDSVNSYLHLDYPKFEVVIANDGSKDKTLELLIEKYELIEVPFSYIEKVYCKPVKKIYKSKNPLYDNLTVVDKVNGGTKADAMNAGVNVAKYDYFINTDVDCILASDTLKKVILPVLDSKTRVIAVGATMRMSNGCYVENGIISRAKPPQSYVPTFQETEYLRSYLVSKMGWSMLNAIPNVSGGFGFFDKEIVINAGGFDSGSYAEDMDMTIRMITFMRERKLKYRITQIPDTCCWTEGPPNIKILNRQRSRWGRGLFQIFVNHRRLLLNTKYGRLGMLILPYSFIFEFLAPIIEFTGILFLIFLLFTNQVNRDTFWLMMLFVYIVGATISLVTISYDLSVKRQFKTNLEYLRLILFSSFEALLYHPFVVIFSLRGYFQFLSRRQQKWGTMTRQGFGQTQIRTQV
ncbi:MAG: glycosyltransferase [Candidatus Gastranaerophilales bacterium]|nr:glycosyltransferase [Candidatus Gastranaerophilales bacterium]